MGKYHKIIEKLQHCMVVISKVTSFNNSGLPHIGTFLDPHLLQSSVTRPNTLEKTSLGIKSSKVSFGEIPQPCVTCACCAK